MPKKHISELIDQVHHEKLSPKWSFFFSQISGPFGLASLVNRFTCTPEFGDLWTYSRNFHLFALSTFPEERGLHLVWFPSWGRDRGGRSLLSIYRTSGEFTISFLFIRISF